MIDYEWEPPVIANMRAKVRLWDDCNARFQALAQAFACLHSGNFLAAMWQLYWAKMLPRDRVTKWGPVGDWDGWLKDDTGSERVDVPPPQNPKREQTTLNWETTS